MLQFLVVPNWDHSLFLHALQDLGRELELQAVAQIEGFHEKLAVSVKNSEECINLQEYHIVR